MPADTLLQAFATPIFLRKNAAPDSLNVTLAETVRRLSEGATSDDAHQAHQGGFYTKGDFFEMQHLPGVADMRQLAAKAVVDYIRQVTGRTDLPSQIQIISWAAITKARDYQTPHIHAGATLSGVYYAVAPPRPEPQGCIDFLTPIDLKEMSFLKGDSNTYCRVVPEPGDLVLFPAYLKHFTHPFFDDDERIVIVFNAHISRD
ncbi:MAG: putative 2OG-Fe(II) oxygenase [Alphaproteobacteria bacterium]